MSLDDFLAESFEHAGCQVSIYQDPEPGSPLEWDNLGIAVAFDYLAGEYREGSFYERVSEGQEDEAYRRGGWQLLARYLRMTEGAEAVPFSMADYGSSGLRIYAESLDTDRVAGFLYADRAKIIAEYGDDSEWSRETARSCLRAEIEALAQYAEGDIYGYIVEEDEEHDSCWGFYGIEEAKAEARSAAECIAREVAINQEPPTPAEVLRS